MSTAVTRRVLHSQLSNNLWSAPAGKEGLRIGRGKMLEPGVVAYDNDDGSRVTYLLPREAIERGRPTAKGKPIIGSAGGFDHMKVNAADQAAGKYDGVALEAFAGGDGWESILFQLKDSKTAEACEDGYEFSCAYIPTEVDETPGVWHNVPYDAVIKNLDYTHFAVVPNPRYNGATIELLNSRKESSPMNAILKAALSLFPRTDVREVLNALDKEDEAAKKAEERKNNLERMKGERRASAQAAYDMAMKNASSDEDRAKAKEALEKANADIEAMKEEAAEAAAAPAAGAPASPESQVPPKPLGGGDVVPEPGLPKPVVEAASSAAAPAPAETPEQAQEREKKALEAKNAADEAAKKKAEEEALEKKNAEDAAKKAAEDKAKKDEEERTNALEKAKADARAQALREERFNALKLAAEERGGASGTAFVGVQSISEKEDLGRARYGSGQ